MSFLQPQTIFIPNGCSGFSMKRRDKLSYIRIYNINMDGFRDTFWRDFNFVITSSGPRMFASLRWVALSEAIDDK